MLTTDDETGRRERLEELLKASASNATKVASRIPPNNLARYSLQEVTVLTGCLTDVTIWRSGDAFNKHPHYVGGGGDF